MKINLFGTASALLGSMVLLSVSATEGLAQTASPTTATPEAATATGEVVVTARRKSENAQTVPVSVSVIDTKTLKTEGIQNTSEMQYLVPGIMLNGAGSPSNTVYTIRGQTKSVAGSGLNSVLTYFNEVPLPTIGSFSPTFDVDNIQILKGPQGTLFGRNTTGGAVLVYSAQPTYKFGGYIQADFGDYQKHSFQGAINLPIVPDKLAVRIAADIERQDGYTPDITTPGQNEDNLNSNAVRFSVLFQPTERVKNVLVLDYYESNTNGIGYFPFQVLNPQLDAAAAAQKALGSRTLQTSIKPFDDEIYWGASNTTSVDLGPVRFKNIFGYRYTNVHDSFNASGLPLVPLPDLGPNVSALGYVPGELGNLITTDNFSVSQQFSDEIQFSGAAFNRKLNWLIGAFFLSEGTAGPDYLALDLFRPVPANLATTTFVNTNLGGVWPIGSLDDTLYSDSSKAVFGNVSYNLGDISPFLGHFTLNGGYRYTWDTEGVCSNGRASIALATGKTLAAPYQSVAQCEADKEIAGIGASFSGTANFSAPTYTLGVDYKVNDNVFFYFTTRRGYRAGGLNTPTLAPILSAFQTYQPQTVTDYEIGAHLKWHVGEWLGHFNIAAYTGQYSGLQLIAAGITAQSGIPGVTAANQPSNTSMTINAGSSVAQGFEFDGSISPFRGLNFTYGGAYLDERYTKFSIPTILTPFFEATNFTGAPRWSFDAAVQYFLPLDPTVGAISLNARYYYIDQEYQGQALLPAYSLTNININWDHMFGKPIALTLYMDNVFNQTYVQDVILSTSSFGAFTGNYGPPRMVGARIRYDF